MYAATSPASQLSRPHTGNKTSCSSAACVCQVVLHPVVRDKAGRKMSKSLGNVIDPLHLIEGVSLDTMLVPCAYLMRWQQCTWLIGGMCCHTQEAVRSGNLAEEEVERASTELQSDFPKGIQVPLLVVVYG